MYKIKTRHRFMQSNANQQEIETNEKLRKNDF